MIVLALLLAAQSQVVAVLEFRDKVPVEQRVDAAYLGDRVRAAVKDLLPQARVITRENMLVLMTASGKDLAGCEGECEVDTGRRIGADLVISGELLRFGTQYKLNMKLHDTRSGELIAGAVASGAMADDLDRDLRPAVEKLLAPLRAEAFQDQLSDQRAAARPAAASPKVETREHGPKAVLLGVWATLGYASTALSGGLSGSSDSAGGVSYGFGGQFLFRVAGPLEIGALADYSFFPSVSGGRTAGLLAGGGLRLDLDPVALSAGAGYSNLSNGGGSGYGILGAVEHGLLRLQLSVRHGSSSAASGLTALDQAETIVAVQAGLSLTF